MHNAIKVFPVGRERRQSVGSRETGQLLAQKYMYRLMISIYAGYDPAATPRRLRGVHLRARKTAEEGGGGGDNDAKRKGGQMRVSNGMGKNGATYTRSQKKNYGQPRRYKQEAEANLCPNKSDGGLCRPSYPSFLRAQKPLAFLFHSRLGIYKAESLSQPLPSRVSYHGFESS